MYHLTEDKRQAERVATERPVKLFVADETFQGKMIDLSIMGTGILAKHSCPHQSKLTIEFSLPSMGAQKLKAEAEVVHTANVRGECLLGLKFDPVVASNQNAINEYIRYHKREF